MMVATGKEVVRCITDAEWEEVRGEDMAGVWALVSGDLRHPGPT